MFVIDEIGKMELFSQSFIRAVRQTLESSSCSILGTIPIPKGKPLALVEEVRSRRDVKVFIVSALAQALVITIMYFICVNIYILHICIQCLCCCVIVLSLTQKGHALHYPLL